MATICPFTGGCKYNQWLMMTCLLLDFIRSIPMTAVRSALHHLLPSVSFASCATHHWYRSDSPVAFGSSPNTSRLCGLFSQLPLHIVPPTRPRSSLLTKSDIAISRQRDLHGHMSLVKQECFMMSKYNQAQD